MSSFEQARRAGRDRHSGTPSRRRAEWGLLDINQENLEATVNRSALPSRIHLVAVGAAGRRVAVRAGAADLRRGCSRDGAGRDAAKLDRRYGGRLSRYEIHALGASCLPWYVFPETRVKSGRAAGLQDAVGSGAGTRLRLAAALEPVQGCSGCPSGFPRPGTARCRLSPAAAAASLAARVTGGTADASGPGCAAAPELAHDAGLAGFRPPEVSGVRRGRSGGGR